MKKLKINFHSLVGILMVAGIMAFFYSCNKTLPQPVANPRPVLNPGSTQTIGAKISSDPNYSIYLAVVTKAGLLPKLTNPNSVWTVFAPDNDAFVRSGIPSAAVINAMPAQQVAAIGMYSIIPGQQYLTSNLGDSFPNVQLPTSLKIADVPGLPVPLEMSAFPSLQNGFWLNNVPVVAPDQKFSNGVMHTPYALAATPSQLVKIAIYSNPNLSFFKAAIEYGDQGKTGLSKIDSLLNYVVLNMTVLVPDDDAMKQLIIGSITGYLLQTNPGMTPVQAQTAAAQMLAAEGTDIFKNPALAAVIPPDDVYGLIAYHILAVKTGNSYQPFNRVYSNNLKTTPTFYKTLVNSSSNPAAQNHPGVLIAPTYTGPAVSKISVTGLGTFPPGGNPYSGAPASAIPAGSFWETNCVNGVYYVIDKVLLPQ
jgi:uncharacterized surface protein with fasciclin (FAS1) repeats